MKHAFLIGVYKNPEYVEKLVDSLNGLKSSIYIHVNDRFWPDFKYMEDKYSKYENVFIYHPYKVNWGGVTLCKSIIYLLNEALKDGQNTYFHIITGQDILIKPLSQLYDYFEANDGSSFIEYSDITQDHIDYRYNKYHAHDIINCQGKNKFLYRCTESILARIQRYVKIRHRRLPFNSIYYGSPWWSLSRDAVEYIISYIESNNLLQTFKYTFAPDETLFQDILLNSGKDFLIINDNLRYIEWNYNINGLQETLKESDYNKLITSKKFFARKVDSNNPESFKLIEKINKYIKQ